MKARALLVFLASLVAIALPVIADGIPMRNGRFGGGPVTVLTLTAKQVFALESGHEIELTHRQSNLLKKQSKVRVYKILVLDSRKGETDCEDFLFNVGLRFSEREIEVPHKYLVPPDKAKWLEEQLNNL